LAGALLIIFQIYLVPIRVRGVSMEPTYHDGGVNFLNQMAYWNRDPKRGDVVGVRLGDSRMILLKRVVALPGEQVDVRHGAIVVDGATIPEDYVRGHEVPSTRETVVLDKDEYFVIGDNRDVSVYGVVRAHEVKGRVLF